MRGGPMRGGGHSLPGDQLSRASGSSSRYTQPEWATLPPDSSVIQASPGWIGSPHRAHERGCSMRGRYAPRTHRSMHEG
jgi:hypothetical protein